MIISRVSSGAYRVKDVSGACISTRICEGDRKHFSFYDGFICLEAEQNRNLVKSSSVSKKQKFKFVIITNLSWYVSSVFNDKWFTLTLSQKQSTELYDWLVLFRTRDWLYNAD